MYKNTVAKLQFFHETTKSFCTFLPFCAKFYHFDSCFCQFAVYLYFYSTASTTVLMPLIFCPLVFWSTFLSLGRATAA